jgi:hypothetical protein
MNALGMRLQPFEIGQGPDISNALAPIQRGIDTYREGMDKAFQGERALNRERLAQRADDRASQSHDMEMQKAKVQQIAGLAQMADQEKDPARRSAIMQRVYGMHPDLVPHLQRSGFDPADHVNVPKMLVAEARGFVDSLTEEAKRAQIAQARQATAAGALDMKLKQRELDSPAAKLTIVPEGGVLVGTDPRTGQSQEIARGNDKTKMPPGYRATTDGNMEAVPGGPADVKMNEKRQQDYASAQQVRQQLDELAMSVNKVMTSPGLEKNFGLQGYVPNMPGGSAANAAALLETLKTQGAFAALQEMRNASKTGGALGAISDREGQMLQNAMAPLAKAQSPQQVRESLRTILDHIERSKQRIADAYNDHWNNAGAAAKQTMGGGPARIRDDSDYARLPSGAQYIDPEGNVRTKR